LYSGSWNLALAFDPALLDRALRAGELYEANFYLSVQGQMKAEQGLFEDADRLAEKLDLIAESFDYNGSRVSCRFVKAFTAIRRGGLHDALAHAEEGFSLTDRAAQTPAKLSFLGFKAMAEVLLGHSEAAMSTVSEGEVLLTTQRTVLLSYLIPFFVSRLLVHLQLLKDALQSGNSSEIVQRKKGAYRIAKQTVRTSRKYAPFRTWILMLMGDYHWLIGKQGKALKWWKRSIEKGQSLGARVDLSRTYFEVGKHLLEPQNKTRHLDGIDGKGYLEKAKILFQEMDLQRDLDELDRIIA
jgi:tetratricopeptide (TPR) repeat protein